MKEFALVVCQALLIIEITGQITFLLLKFFLMNMYLKNLFLPNQLNIGTCIAFGIELQTAYHELNGANWKDLIRTIFTEIGCRPSSGRGYGS